MRKKEWIVSKENHQSRIDDFAYQHQITKKALKAIKLKGNILVNGEHQTVRYLLNEGDRVTFFYPKEENQIPPINIPLKIVYEDDVLLVIDKQAGLPCIPTRAHPTYTLANALSYYYQHIGLESTVHLVNRLDKDTKGLMIVAKYRDIHDCMCKDMTHIKRVYHAHVKGKLDSSGTISLPIYRDGFEMKRVIDKRGQTAITHYRCLKQKEHSTLIECLLETGRTHQIRVHMAALGYPLIGDAIYGDNDGEFDLDSVKVCFEHPVTHQYICIEKK